MTLSRRFMRNQRALKTGERKTAVFYMEQEGKKVSPKIVLDEGSYSMKVVGKKKFKGRDLKTGKPQIFKREAIVIRKKDAIGTANPKKIRKIYYLNEGTNLSDFPRNKVNIEVCESKGIAKISGFNGVEKRFGGKNPDSFVKKGNLVIRNKLSSTQIRDMIHFLDRRGIKSIPKDAVSLYNNYLVEKVRQEQEIRPHLTPYNEWRMGGTANQIYDWRESCNASFKGSSEKIRLSKGEARKIANDISMKSGFNRDELMNFSPEFIVGIGEEYEKRRKIIESENFKVNKQVHPEVPPSFDPYIKGVNFLSLDSIKKAVKAKEMLDDAV